MDYNGIFCHNHAQTIKDVMNYAKTGIRADTEEGRVFGGRYRLSRKAIIASHVLDVLLAILIIYGTYKFWSWLM